MSYITDLTTHALPKDNDREYYVDFFDQNLDTTISFRPENWTCELNLREPDTISLDITFSALDMSGATIVTHDFIGPYRNGWLLRQGWVPIQAGLITSVTTQKGSDFMTVGGKSWLHYFERRQFPFNGDPTVSGNDEGQLESYTGSKPGFGYNLDTSIDVITHLTHILDKVLAKTDSWPITYSLSTIGKNIKYDVPLGDQRFVSDMIGELSDIAPGFDYRTTWDMIFQIASPYFYGDPTTFDITDSTDSHWAFVFDNSSDAKTPFDISFTNNGPIATHVSGYNSIDIPAVTIGYGPGQDQFGRLDASYDFGDISNADALDAKTSKQLAFDLQPQHEIPLSVLPNNITNFWTIFKPGVAIFVDQELGYHRIDSGQRIVQMSISDDGSIGEPICEIGLNQVYDTADNIGVNEG